MDKLIQQFLAFSPLARLGVAVGAFLLLVFLWSRLRNRRQVTIKRPAVDPAIQRKLMAGNYEDAARLEVQRGNLESAMEYYLQAQKPARAAQLALRLKRPRQAAELYERAREFPKAIELYRQAGLQHKADELASLSGADRLPGDPAPDAGSPQGLQTPLERANRAEIAVRECLVQAQKGNTEAAAKLDALARDAAEALLAAGEPQRAAEICREAGLVDQAINLFVNLLGDAGAAAQLLSQRGDHRRAAELYEAAGQKERSLASWIEWSKQEVDPLLCLPEVDRLGRDATFQMLDTLVLQRPLRAETMDLHYRIAEAYEQRDNPQSAAPLLQRIVVVDSGFRDARARLDRVQVLAEAAPAKAAPAVERAAPADSARARTIRAFEAPSASPQPGTAAREEPDREALEKLIDQSALERLVSEVAAAAASQAASLVRRQRSAPISILELDSEQPPPAALRQTARGIERIAISLRYANDSAVEAMRQGPSVEELRAQIGGRAIDRGNVDLFYQLGLAEVAAGRWLDARQAFQAIEQVAPSYRDVSKRNDELTRWADAVSLQGKGPDQALAQRYKLLGEIGRGGMAVVYRAHDQALGREVAMKFLSEEISEKKLMLELFQREARSAAQLNHPNIVTIFDVGVLGGRAFICMELVTGTSMEKIIQRDGRLQVMDVLRIGVQILSALEYAHGKSIIHRDIKPANMMRNELGVVKLMDFGLAKSTETGGKTSIVAGTPAYMAPEQFTGRDMDATTDLFALGASLYEMLAGSPPFEGMRRDKPAPRLSSLNATVPKALEGIILRSLELEKGKRFASAREMRRPLEQILSSVTQYLQKRGAAGTVLGVDTGSSAAPSRAASESSPAEVEPQRAGPGGTLPGLGARKK